MARLRSVVTLSVIFLVPLGAFAPAAEASHPDEDAFAALHDALPLARTAAAFAWTGETAYLFGGLSPEGDALGDIVVYDPATGASSTIGPDEVLNDAVEPPEFPMRHAWSAVWDAGNDRALLFGGVEFACINDNCGYAPVDDALAFYPADLTWERLAMDDATNTSWRASVLVGDEVLLFGGCTLELDFCTDDVRSFHLDTETFTTVDALPLPAGRMLALAEDGDIHLVGGYTTGDPQQEIGAGILDTILSYDRTDGITQAGTLALPVADAAGFVDGLDVFVLGGFAQLDGEMATDAIQRWRQGDDASLHLEGVGLPAPAALAHAAFATPFAYVMGGEDGSGIAVDDVVQLLPRPVATDASLDGVILTLGAQGSLAEPIDAFEPSDFTLTVNGGIDVPILDLELADGNGLTLVLPAGLGSEDEAVLSFDPSGSSPADAWGNPMRAFEDLPVDITPPAAGSLPTPRYYHVSYWDADLEAVVTLGGVDDACAMAFGWCDDTTSIAYFPADGATQTLASFQLGSPSAAVMTPDGLVLVAPETDAFDDSESTIYLYDTAAHELSAIGTIPVGALYGASAAFDGAHFLYVFGGYELPCSIECSGGDLTDGIWRLDLSDPGAEATLLSLALPTPREWTVATWLATTDCPDGCAYVLGGEDEGGALDAIVRFDPTAGIVENVTVLPGPRVGGAAIAVDGTILHLGGTDAEGSPTASVTRFFPESGATFTLPALSSTRYDAAYASDGSTVHQVGGTDQEFLGILPIDAYALDVEAPDILASLTVLPAANELGWHNAPVVIAWTPEEGNSYGMSLDGQEYLEQSSMELSTEEPEGTLYQVHLRETDAFGNTHGTVREVGVDLVAPTVEISGPSVATSDTVSLVLSFSEPMDKPSVQDALVGAAGWSRSWNGMGTALTLSTNDLSTGNTTISIDTDATDAHGVPLAEGASHSILRERTSSSGGGSDRDRSFVIVSEPEPTPVANDTIEEPAANQTPTEENATIADPLPVEPTPPADPVDEGEPLASDSVTRGTDGDAQDADAGEGSVVDDVDVTPQEPFANEEPEATAQPEILFEGSIGAGVRGVITFRLGGVERIEDVSVVLLDADGVETVIATGLEVITWDTASVPDGYYTIVVRRGAPTPAAGELAIAQSETELASARVLVRNDVAVPLEAAGAAVAGILVIAGVHAGVSALSSGASTAMSGAGGGFDAFGFAQEVAGDAAEDKIREKRGQREAALLERRRRMRSVLVAAISLVLLAGLWAFSSMESWSVSAWLRALPVIGIAAVVVMSLKYTSEAALAHATGARARVRLLISGAIALAFSSIVLRNPFGYPGYVDEVGESEAKGTWRMQGLRALAVIAGAAAFMLPFLALATVVPWGFVSVGVLLAVTNVATTAMPFGPLPGRDVWRWNKAAAIGVALAAFGLYVSFASGIIPHWALWTIALAGAALYATAIVRFRRARAAKAHAVRVPVQVAVPVKLEEPASKLRIEDSEKRN